jgi:hypothetical protein
MVELYLS